MTVRLIVILVGALVLAPPGQAAPPMLVKVDHVQRHPRASWVLAPGSVAFGVEVATRPDTGSDGSFFGENIEDIAILESGQTTWLSSGRLKPGTYYVHVGSYQPDCLPCPIPEWSNVLPLVVKNQRPSISRLRIRQTGPVCGSDDCDLPLLRRHERRRDRLHP